MGVSRLLRILGACALALGLMLFGGPAFASPGYGSNDPTVSLSTSATRGEIVAVGENFEPGETVTGTVYSKSKSLGTKTADSDGRVKFTFNVSDLGLSAGRHKLVLSADSGSASAWFTVLRGHSDDDSSVVDVSDSSDSDSSDDSSSDSSSSDDSDGSSSSDSSDGSSGGSSSDGSSSDGSSSSDSSEGGLAFTGSNVIVPLSVVGGLLLVGGGLALVSSRRNRNKTHV